MRASTFRRAAMPLLVAVAAVASVWVSAQAPQNRGLVWSIERDGSVDWLVGSLHMLTADAYPLPESLVTAFEASDTLLEEADPAELRSPELAVSLLTRAFFTDGQTLDQRVAPDTFRLLTTRAAAAGLPPEFLNRMKPWMAATTLQAMELQRAGFDPALGLDAHFQERARQRGTRFETLETALAQIQMLENLGDEFEDALITQTLEDARTAVEDTGRLAAAWKAGDVAMVERLVLDSMRATPAVYSTLIRDRNRAWLPRIRACVDSRRCFIVVGAGHLIGADGVVNALQQAGYTVTQR